MKEKYNIVISERQAVPRSKRMRESGQSISSAAVLVSGSSGGNSSCDGHTHTNLPALERIGFDENDDKYLTVRVGSVDDGTGELIITHERAKAGYADKAHDLDDDSPVRDEFVSKIDDDIVGGLITFLEGLVSEGPIESNDGVFIPPFTSGVLGTGACLKRNPVTGKTYLEADEIYVRLKAVFDTLEICHTTHVGGQQILSPAGMTCLRVEEYDTYYRCFMKADDGNKAIQNLFAENDQAQCRDINVKEGIYENVSNQYYWRLVTGVGDDYIDLSKDDCDKGSTFPAAGDNICQLGNRTDRSRQNAIVLSTVGPNAPSFKQYAGIDSYSLDGKEVTQLSPNGNKLTGVLHIESGSTGAGNLFDLPDEIQEAVQVGSVNLIVNSGFTGNYESENLEPDSMLSPDSEMYNNPLNSWSGNATVLEDDKSSSGCSAEIGAISQNIKGMILGEKYVFSFRAKGTDITVAMGTLRLSQPLTGEFEKYIFKFTFSGESTLLLSGTAVIYDLKLERGTISTDWTPSPYDNEKFYAKFQNLSYLTSAIKEGSVDMLGGLILANMVQFGNYKDGKMQKVTSGISGIYNDDNDVVQWGGGTFEEAIRAVMMFKDNPSYQPSEDELKSIAKFVVTHGGRSILNDVVVRGYIYALGGVFSGKVSIANEKILLNEDGSGWLANKAIMWDKDGKAYGDLFDKQYAMNTNYVELPTVPKGSIKQIILPYFVVRAILTYEIKFANQSDFIVYKEGTNTRVVTGDTQISFGKLGHGIIRLTGICFDADSSNTRWVAEDINFGLNG
jgi:hypothetical protein